MEIYRRGWRRCDEPKAEFGRMRRKRKTIGIWNQPNQPATSPLLFRRGIIFRLGAQQHVGSRVCRMCRQRKKLSTIHWCSDHGRLVAEDGWCHNLAASDGKKRSLVSLLGPAGKMRKCPPPRSAASTTHAYIKILYTHNYRVVNLNPPPSPRRPNYYPTIRLLLLFLSSNFSASCRTKMSPHNGFVGVLFLGGPR